MSVFYRLRKNNNSKSAQYGKYYARAVHVSTLTTNDIANIIQRNCSVKRSDVKAVIEELIEVMNDALQNSQRVKLEGFGTFKLGIRTAPADSAEEFTVNDNVTGLRVNFQPETKVSAEGTRTKQFLVGCTVQELPVYDKKEIAGEE